jgi:hypothetical protein
MTAEWADNLLRNGRQYDHCSHYSGKLWRPNGRVIAALHQDCCSRPRGTSKRSSPLVPMGPPRYTPGRLRCFIRDSRASV